MVKQKENTKLVFQSNTLTIQDCEAVTLLVLQNTQYNNVDLIILDFGNRTYTDELTQQVKEIIDFIEHRYPKAKIIFSDLTVVPDEFLERVRSQEEAKSDPIAKQLLTVEERFKRDFPDWRRVYGRLGIKRNEQGEIDFNEAYFKAVTFLYAEQNNPIVKLFKLLRRGDFSEKTLKANGFENKENFYLSVEENLYKSDRSNSTLYDLVYYCQDQKFLDGFYARKADKFKIDKEGNSLLHWACVLRQSIKEIQILIEKNANIINQANESGITPLHQAARRGDKKTVEYLLAHGANVNAVDRRNATPLRHAALRGHLSIAAILVLHGAKINWVDKSGFSVLHGAVYSGETALVRFLLDKRASINKKNKFKKTPLHSGILNDDITMVECLLDNGAEVDQSAFEIAVKQDNIRMLQCLRKYAVPENESTLYIVAASLDNPAMIKFLYKEMELKLSNITMNGISVTVETIINDRSDLYPEANKLVILGIWVLSNMTRLDQINIILQTYINEVYSELLDFLLEKNMLKTLGNFLINDCTLSKEFLASEYAEDFLNCYPHYQDWFDEARRLLNIEEKIEAPVPRQPEVKLDLLEQDKFGFNHYDRILLFSVECDVITKIFEKVDYSIIQKIVKNRTFYALPTGVLFGADGKLAEIKQEYPQANLRTRHLKGAGNWYDLVRFNNNLSDDQRDQTVKALKGIVAKKKQEYTQHYAVLNSAQQSGRKLSDDPQQEPNVEKSRFLESRKSL